MPSLPPPGRSARVCPGCRRRRDAIARWLRRLALVLAVLAGISGSLGLFACLLALMDPFAFEYSRDPASDFARLLVLFGLSPWLAVGALCHARAHLERWLALPPDRFPSEMGIYRDAVTDPRCPRHGGSPDR